MGCPSTVILEDNLVFTVTTHLASSGALTDADAVPAYRVYEDETGTAILTGNMAKLDDASTTGFYSESLACTAANGFEDGKTYSVYITAAVSSVTGGISYGFKATAALATAASITSLNDLDAAGIRTAVGLASADLDTQLAAVVTDLDDVKGTGFVKDTHSLVDIEAYVDDITGDVTTSLNAYDPPTTAEMNARTLAAASYFDPAADTVANVTTVATVTNQVTADVTAISGDATAADNLEASLETMVTGTVSAGTHTTALIDASDVTGHDNDTFNGRVLLFRTGALQYEAGVITDYVSATGQIVFAADTFTAAPTATTDTFVIV